jgi:hypothetical protein
MTEHPITPTHELITEWLSGESSTRDSMAIRAAVIRAAHWGSDQELEACCEWLRQNVGRWEIPEALRDARRPKPPSLKEQALSELDSLENMGACNADTIRRALEQLDD